MVLVLLNLTVNNCNLKRDQPGKEKHSLSYLGFFLVTACILLQEVNAILGEKLSAEDEEEVLAEFENLESQVCLFMMQLLLLKLSSFIFLQLYAPSFDNTITALLSPFQLITTNHLNFPTGLYFPFFV